MVMDYLRSCYSASFRPYADSAIEGKVYWFRAAPGAKRFPHAHAYGSNVWEDQTGEQKQGVGEVGFTRRWRSCRNPDLAGDHFEGPADWLLNGVPLAHAGDQFAPCNAWLSALSFDVLVDWHFEPEPEAVVARFDVLVAWNLEDHEVFTGVRALGAVSLTGSIDQQTLVLTTPEYDTSTFWDGGTPPVLTVPADGIYLVGVEVDGVTNGTTATPVRVKLGVVQNGTTEIATDERDLGGTGISQIETFLAVTEVELSAGDEITAVVGWVAGGSSPAIDLTSIHWIDYRGPLP